MMKIGFDAKRAFLNYTGLGNYSRSVITSLHHYFPEQEYFLYTPKTVQNARTAGLQAGANLHIRQPAIPILKSLWRSRLVVPRLQQDGLDLYHGLSHELPLGLQKTGIRSVVTIHDLIFLRYPQYYKLADRKIYEAKFRHACNNADRIVAISEQTRNDICNYFGTPAGKIKVVYQSCDPAFTQTATAVQLQQVKAKYQLPETYLLSVGTIEARKNLLLVIRALALLQKPLKLVVIGKGTAYLDQVKTEIARLQLTDRVLFLEQVPFADLPALYQLAHIFLYPSEFEGFGIPILEALYSGAPVIAATGSCLEEAGGPDSVYVHPQDEQGLATAIDNITNNSEQRGQMITAGKKYAALFTERRQAEQLMAIYRELTGKV
ncbi:glycosyltransferase family 4 protein [Taibaiella chishuiensis]|uniref:Glycosyltransferase involved in cell wall biosynthesis n=1 Tax=Taibaiella chishuiensis TaxID=1434707 RepID=A0A2P8CVT3_9BACT|nr:glycosyltransferase family 1 protein [Taibaiella chishuiensis]PSK89056.1 glycosyltransferase involved in cell wall biosynthesis [Taibaiella chishuiensis]